MRSIKVDQEYLKETKGSPVFRLLATDGFHVSVWREMNLFQCLASSNCTGSLNLPVVYE
jgi:hypothetical protein